MTMRWTSAIIVNAAPQSLPQHHSKPNYRMLRTTGHLPPCVWGLQLFWVQVVEHSPNVLLLCCHAFSIRTLRRCQRWWASKVNMHTHMKGADKQEACCGAPTKEVGISDPPTSANTRLTSQANPCAGKKPSSNKASDHAKCFRDGVATQFEQTSDDISVNFKGTLNATGRTPQTFQESRKIYMRVQCSWGGAPAPRRHPSYMGGGSPDYSVS